MKQKRRTLLTLHFFYIIYYLGFFSIQYQNSLLPQGVIFKKVNRGKFQKPDEVVT